jgi:hypothetical protein
MKKEKLINRINTLGEVEISILAHLAKRLALGAAQYGTFCLDDKRDFIEETVEENLDAMVYLTAELKRLQRKRGGGN